MTNWDEAPIARHHNREAFDCGEVDLNVYLQRYARQNHETGVSRAFVLASPDEPSKILGYYTLSPASIEFDKVPESARHRLPRYELPVFRLGRLAVDVSMQGQGLGRDLFLAAGHRCITAASEVGGVAMLIDAKNERVAAWYHRFGAVSVPEHPLVLIVRLDLIAHALAEREREGLD